MVTPAGLSFGRTWVGESSKKPTTDLTHRSRKFAGKHRIKRFVLCLEVRHVMLEITLTLFWLQSGRDLRDFHRIRDRERSQAESRSELEQS